MLYMIMQYAKYIILLIAFYILAQDIVHKSPVYQLWAGFGQSKEHWTCDLGECIEPGSIPQLAQISIVRLVHRLSHRT